jgi:hypothetical protein
LDSAQSDALREQRLNEASFVKTLIANVIARDGFAFENPLGIDG